jgi:homoserine kinase
MGHGLMLPLAMEPDPGSLAAPVPDDAGLAAPAASLGALDAAAEIALQTGRGVVVLWPYPPVRFSTFALPDWAVALVTPALPESASEASAFLGKTLIGKAAATFASRAVAVTEGLRTGSLDLLSFALDDGSLTDLLGAGIPGLQPALAAAREEGTAAGLSRFRGRRCIVALHPDADRAAAAAAAAAERWEAHSIPCEVTLTRFARRQPEPRS